MAETDRPGAAGEFEQLLAHTRSFYYDLWRRTGNRNPVIGILTGWNDEPLTETQERRFLLTIWAERAVLDGGAIR